MDSFPSSVFFVFLRVADTDARRRMLGATPDFFFFF